MVLEALSGSPFKLLLNEFHHFLFKSLPLTSAMSQNLIQMHLLQVFSPTFMRTFKDSFSDEVRSIGVVDERISNTVQAWDHHNLWGNFLDLEWWLGVRVHFSCLSCQLSFFGLFQHLSLLVKRFVLNGLGAFRFLVVLDFDIHFFAPEFVIVRVFGVRPVLVLFKRFRSSKLILRHWEWDLALEFVDLVVVSSDSIIFCVYSI